MDDPIARKLAQLGLDRRGVVSPLQAALAASRERDPLDARVASRPGARELVLSTRIAGTDEPAVDAGALAALEPGARLELEPAGDDLRFLDAHGRAVGRVPRESARDLASLLAAGEELSARVTSIDARRDWTDVAVEVLAREAAAALDGAHAASDGGGCLS